MKTRISIADEEKTKTSSSMNDWTCRFASVILLSALVRTRFNRVHSNANQHLNDSRRRTHIILVLHRKRTRKQLFYNLYTATVNALQRSRITYAWIIGSTASSTQFLMAEVIKSS